MIELLALTIAERVERIEKECATHLGFAMRGVSSWDQEYLMDWRDRTSLTPAEMARLMEIETQVFG